VFERFTSGARASVEQARKEAEALCHNYIGTEHLLLGVLREGTGVGARALGRVGVRLGDVRSDVVRVIGEGESSTLGRDDADALRAIGIDLQEVRHRFEEAFGAGALDRRHYRAPRHRRGRRGRCAAVGVPWAGPTPFTPRAKKALELASRESRRLHHDAIGTEHIVLGLIRDPHGLAARLLAERGASPQRVRAEVMELVARRGDPPGRSA
jgi:ATP-dependent Clp protease ATP-binding subunit ClpA